MFTLSACELTKKFKNKELSAVEITKRFLERAKGENLGALLSILEKRALNKAKSLDEKLKASEPLGLLAAVPVIVKDNIMIEGEVCTCGSKFLEDYHSSFDASVVKELEKEDAIIIAKANMDEFAMGSSNETSAYKPCDNPWKKGFSPGGSSGGSAASVAARLAPISLGTDTGGSVRQPAAFCGLYGLKPTYGRVSRYGVVAFASSLDQVGPFAHNIDDIALLSSVINRPCNKDSTSIHTPAEKYHEALSDDIKGLRIGIPTHLLEGTDPEILESFDEFIQTLKSCGATTTEICLPNNKYSVPIYYILAPAEASTNLARFDGIRYGKRSAKAKSLSEVYEMSRTDGFGKEVVQRILLGTYVLSAGFQDAYYTKAQKVRRKIFEDYDNAFNDCDIVAFPTTTIPSFKRGSITDPLTMYKQDIYTISANMAGLPALSIPSGFTKEGLPIGIQIQSKQMDDQRLMNVAKAFETKNDSYSKIPAYAEEVEA
ncbi:MAG: Glutamyl-tRNA(Gln) amidotransferase subunit A [Chlamydiia bacterium]|nr:Glutamyl-tRNA(Gln) amidotransferase subunit A [Chlamydiia bacterium]